MKTFIDSTHDQECISQMLWQMFIHLGIDAEIDHLDDSSVGISTPTQKFYHEWEFCEENQSMEGMDALDHDVLLKSYIHDEWIELEKKHAQETADLMAVAQRRLDEDSRKPPAPRVIKTITDDYPF